MIRAVECILDVFKEKTSREAYVCVVISPYKAYEISLFKVVYIEEEARDDFLMP